MAKKPKPNQADASFSPEGRTICSACWSTLNVSERHERGRASVETDLPWEIQGTRHTLAYTPYICCNPECQILTWVWKISGLLGRESVAPFKELRTLRAADARKYNAGKTRRGVWCAPSPLTPTSHGGAQDPKEENRKDAHPGAAPAAANDPLPEAAPNPRRRRPLRRTRR